MFRQICVRRVSSGIVVLVFRTQDHRSGMTFCTFGKSIYIIRIFFGYLVGRLVIFLILIYIYIYWVSQEHIRNLNVYNSHVNKDGILYSKGTGVECS
jgi:hypothetical protein